MKAFKLILKRVRNSPTFFARLDMERHGKVTLDYSEVEVGPLFDELHEGIYILSIKEENDKLCLQARGPGGVIGLVHSKLLLGDHQCQPICRDPKLNKMDRKKVSRMRWENIHNEVYHAMRDRYPAYLEVRKISTLDFD